jgi:hypothetical protein
MAGLFFLLVNACGLWPCVEGPLWTVYACFSSESCTLGSLTPGTLSPV